MWFVKHPRCNRPFRAPQGMTEQEVATLWVETKRDPQFGIAHTSFWKPDAEDLAKLQAGGTVALTIFGSGHPVLSMAVEDAAPEGPSQPSAGTGG